MARSDEIDLKLLSIFDEIYRTRSVSKAGANLGLSQSAISIGLGKLRQHFDDPLFVRTSSGMQPTPCAEDLVQPLREGLELVRSALRHHTAFDPRTSNRAFRVCFTDISEIVLLPAIAQRVLATAPNVRLEITHITETIPKSLESGAADVAVGFMPQLEAGFRQQRLFRQEFVCLASEQHPRIKGALTLKQFTAEAHLAVTTSGTGHWIVERTLEESRIERRIVLRVPSFLGLAAVIGATQLLAIVPRRLGETLLPQGKIKILDLPVKIPSYVVKQHWHERYHRDPGNIWLRQAIREIFAE